MPHMWTGTEHQPRSQNDCLTFWAKTPQLASVHLLPTKLFSLSAQQDWPHRSLQGEIKLWNSARTVGSPKIHMPSTSPSLTPPRPTLSTSVSTIPEADFSLWMYNRNPPKRKSDYNLQPSLQQVASTWTQLSTSEESTQGREERPHYSLSSQQQPKSSVSRLCFIQQQDMSGHVIGTAFHPDQPCAKSCWVLQHRQIWAFLLGWPCFCLTLLALHTCTRRSVTMQSVKSPALTQQNAEVRPENHKHLVNLKKDIGRVRTDFDDYPNWWLLCVLGHTTF